MTLRLRARDKHDRRSLETEEIFLFQPNPDLGSFQNVSISPQTGSIGLTFNALFQNASHYQITRSVNGGTYELLISLPIAPSGSYQYQDTAVTPSSFYRYRIGVVLAGNTQLWYHQTLAAQPLRPITISDQAAKWFERSIDHRPNFFAKDGLDALDIEKEPPDTNQPYVWLASQTDDPELHLSRDLRLLMTSGSLQNMVSECVDFGLKL